MNGESLEKIRINNWKQGIIVDNDVKDRIISCARFPDNYSKYDCLVLFTHNCDLFNPSLEKEPFAEFFCVKKVESCNYEFAYGKNPRKMQIELTDGFVYEFDINRKVSIDRRVLVDIKLEVHNSIIQKNEMDLILGWHSKKYSRSAFPDEFNKILKEIPRIDKRLTKINSDYTNIKRIFFLVDPDDEINTDEDYQLGIIILLNGLSFESGDDVDDIICRFESIFDVDRISLDLVDCRYEDEMTVYELGVYKVWDKEYITLRNEFPE